MTKQQAKSFCAGITALVITACVLSACGGVDQISQVSSSEVKTKNAALITRTTPPWKKSRDRQSNSAPTSMSIPSTTTATTTTIALPSGCYESLYGFPPTLICPPSDPQRYVRPANPKYKDTVALEGESCTRDWNVIGVDLAMVPGKNARGETDDFVCWVSTYRPADMAVNPVWYRESTLIKAAQAR